MTVGRAARASPGPAGPIGSRRRPGPKGTAGASTATLAVVLALVVVSAGTLVAIHEIWPAPLFAPASGTLAVVAAENFWGSLATLLGGSHVRVLSLVSDPNADPHEFESNTTDAAAVADARLVVENGAGYDDWCSQLVAASGSPGQIVLNVGSLLGRPVGSNPHFWYGQSYVVAVVAAIYTDLVRLDPADRGYFQAQYGALNASLAPVWAREAYIAAHWGGGRVEVASTESIFVYLANSTGLDLVSPVEFMAAVSEGNDPPAQSVTLFEDQLASGNVSLLVYNEQTVTALTQTVRSIAVQHHVGLVPVTETIQPPTESFPAWMGSELSTLQTALNASAAVR